MKLATLQSLLSAPNPFRPMDDLEKSCYSGAEPGSLISNEDARVIIVHPATGAVTLITYRDDGEDTAEFTFLVGAVDTND